MMGVGWAFWEDGYLEVGTVSFLFSLAYETKDLGEDLPRRAKLISILILFAGKGKEFIICLHCCYFNEV